MCDRSAHSSRFLISVAFILSLSGVDSRLLAEDYLKAGRYQFWAMVHLKDFCKLKANMKKADVDTLLGHKGEYEFSYLDQNSSVVWHLVYYNVVPQQSYVFTEAYPKVPELSYNGCFVLFRNQKVYALTNSLTEYFLDLKEDKTNAERLDNLELLDDFKIRKALESISDENRDIPKFLEAFSQNNREYIKEHHARVKAMRPQFPRAFIFAYKIAAGSGIKAARKQNLADIKKFDPHKVAIQMSEKQVISYFGDAVYREKFEDGLHIGIYTPDPPAAVGSEYQCTPILVVYDQGSVIRIVSHYTFFNRKWLHKWVKF